MDALHSPHFVCREATFLGCSLWRRGTKSAVVVEGIQDLDRLTTVRWTESVVVTKESDDSSLEQYLTGEKIVLGATGEVEAGVDLTALGPDDVDVEGEKVTVRLPEPEILSSSPHTRLCEEQR